MMSKIGAVIFMIGVTMADSEWLIVPISMVAIGAYLMWKGGAFNDAD